MQRVKCRPILPGETFSVAAPSSCLDSKLLKLGEAKILDQNYYLSFKPEILHRCRYMAGTDAERARILLATANDVNTAAIWCARGGFGATRILPLLRKNKFAAVMKRRRKLLIGYSDITALHSFVWKSAALPGVHAPLMATPSWLNMKPRAMRDFFALLAGEIALGKESPMTRWPSKFISPPREASGILLGGNLSVLCALVGTPWQPSFAGAILFLEDVGEAPYRIDRMLAQLTQAGCFRGIRGVALGDLSHDVPKLYLRRTHWREVIRDHFDGYKIPIIEGLPVGHAPRNEALPLGARMRINRAGKLELLEQIVNLH